MPKYLVIVKDVASQAIEVDAPTLDEAVDVALSNHNLRTQITDYFEIADNPVVESVEDLDTGNTWKETSSFSGQLAPVSTNDAD